MKLIHLEFAKSTARKSYKNSVKCPEQAVSTRPGGPHRRLQSVIHVIKIIVSLFYWHLKEGVNDKLSKQTEITGVFPQGSRI